MRQEAMRRLIPGLRAAVELLRQEQRALEDASPMTAAAYGKAAALLEEQRLTLVGAQLMTPDQARIVAARLGLPDHAPTC